MSISIENGSIRFEYKQPSSRPLTLSTTRISSKNDLSKSIDCRSFDLENLTPSITIIEELLKYALVNYPYVDSILVYFHDVVNSSDMCFHAFEEDDETNNKDTAVARLSAASNNDTTPDDGNGGTSKDSYQFRDLALVGIELSQEIARSLNVPFTKIRRIHQYVGCVTEEDIKIGREKERPKHQLYGI